MRMTSEAYGVNLGMMGHAMHRNPIIGGSTPSPAANKHLQWYEPTCILVVRLGEAVWVRRIRRRLW